MTTFYHSELLATTGEKNRFGSYGVFAPIPVDEAKKKLASKYPSYEQYYCNDKSASNLTDSKIDFLFNQDRTRVTVVLKLTGKEATLDLAQFTLSTIDCNCGSVLLSNLYTEFKGCGFGKYLMDQVMNYLTKADYSYIILNTAGSCQNPLGFRFFKERYGFSPMNHPYVNKRSANVNVWFYKFLTGVRDVSLAAIPTEYKEESYDEDEDYDEESV